MCSLYYYSGGGGGGGAGFSPTPLGGPPHCREMERGKCGCACVEMHVLAF